MVSRRQFLSSAATLSGFGVTKTLYDRLSDEEKTLYDSKDVESRYPNLEGDKDLIVENVYVEGENFANSAKTYVKDLFEDRLEMVDNDYTVPRGFFYSEYGPESDRVLGENDSLYDHMVDDQNRDFIQAFFVPGIRAGDYEGKIKTESCTSVDYAVGFAGCYGLPEARFLLTDLGDRYSEDLREVRSAWLYLHELGHTLGLEHNEESVIMGFDRYPYSFDDIEFTENEWGRINEILE